MQELNSMIDHTLLKPETSKSQIEQLCREALEWKFASVCVNPTWVETCAKLLQGSSVKVCTVIGFPLGATLPSVKAFETVEAIKYGASEIDMVINVGALKEGNFKLVEDDIKAVVSSARGSLVKVILETCLLNDEEIMKGCQLAEKAGAHFVKTSTGFSTGGAKVEQVKLMRKMVGDRLGVKASGGIRDVTTAKMMIDAGANRLGTSSGIAIVQGSSASSHY
ncbi:MAG: deoxyribose-phosphate aldolase [Bdellovibrio sp.]